MDRIHFEVADAEGIKAACCVWVNGRALTEMVHEDWYGLRVEVSYRHRFLPVCSVQPLADYWLGRTRHQVDRWVLLLHEPIEETGDSSWIATQVTVRGTVIRWSPFITKVGLCAGRGEVWPHPRIGPFHFSRNQYGAALRRLAQQHRTLRRVG